MQIRRVRVEESEIDRFVEECWFPYHKDVCDAVATHSLKPGIDPEDVVEHYRDVLDSPSVRLWVALDGPKDSTASFSTTDATFAGFVLTELEPTLPTFEWPPDRMRIHDLWVAEAYRGSGLATELVARTKRQARENGCQQLVLSVENENDRAVAYFQRLGFETAGFGLHVPLDEVELPRDEGLGTSEDWPSVNLRRVRVEESDLRRFVEEAWEPFWRALEAADDRPRLGPDWSRDDVVEEFLETLDTPDKRIWVALDDVTDPTDGLGEVDAIFAGWLGAGLAQTDRFLHVPERLKIARLYADPQYRGRGLADRLMMRAIQYAKEEGCVEFSLDVGLDNERARAYYEKLGFEAHELRMTIDVDGLEV